MFEIGAIFYNAGMILDILYTIPLLPYARAYERQKLLHDRRVAGDIQDTLWLLEHYPVLTTGLRKNQQDHIRMDPKLMGMEIIQTKRGGNITWHGPGQLVGYIFIDMENHGFKVKDFIFRMEEAFINYLAEKNIMARHDDEHTGVWVGMDKITAIGIALHNRVTLHGFAFNVNPDLRYFDCIVPCGISDASRGLTSLEKLLDKSCNMEQIAKDLSRCIRAALGYDAGTYTVERE